MGQRATWVGQAETEASERITHALVASRPGTDVEREIINTMIFPFKLPASAVRPAVATMLSMTFASVSLASWRRKAAGR
jgi:hypothetical protein